MIKQVFHFLGRLGVTLILNVEPVKEIEESPCIVAANHNSHVDVMILFRLFEISRISQVRVVAAEDYFSKGLKGYIARWMFNLVLIKRGGIATNALETISNELAQGRSIIMFPEGSRGKPGVMGSFKAGIGKLAVEFPSIPIYPVYLSGAERALPRGSWLPVPFSIQAKVLKPIFGRDFTHTNPREAIGAIAIDVETRIRDAGVLK